jgi:hypothetical protein
VFPSVFSAYDDNAAVLAQILASVAFLTQLVVVSLGFFAADRVYDRVHAYWREHRPVRVREWIRKRWGRASKLVDFEVSSILGMLIKKAGNERAYHHHKFKSYVRSANAKHAAVEAHVARAAERAAERDELLKRAELHMQAGLQAVPDDPHYKDWSEVPRLYTIEELKAIGVKPKTPTPKKAEALKPPRVTEVHG